MDLIKNIAVGLMAKIDDMEQNLDQVENTHHHPQKKKNLSCCTYHGQ